MEAALLSVAVLACPVGMGLMMWFMAKDMRKGPSAAHVVSAPSSAQAPVDAGVEQLREEHQRLAAEIERLEAQESDRVLSRS